MERDSNHRWPVKAEITNTLKWPMTYPSSYTENGKISMNPRLIAPGTKKSVTTRTSDRVEPFLGGFGIES